MPDESKRLLVAVFLCLGILFVWQSFFAPEPPPPDAKKEASEETPSGGVHTPPGESAAPTVPESAGPAVSGAESTARFKGQRYEAILTSHGGALKSYKLTDSRFREERNGEEVPIDLVQPGVGLPLEVALEGHESARSKGWHIAEQAKGKFLLSKEQGGLRVTKQLDFDARGWVADVTIGIENRGDQARPVRLSLLMHGRQPPDAPTRGMMTPGVRVWQSVCHANGEIERADHASLKKEEENKTGEILWAGIEDKYFLLAAIPVQGDEKLRCDMQAGPNGALITSISYAKQAVAPGESRSYRLRVYLGPKDLDGLDAVTVEGADPRLGEAVDYGWLRVLCEPMIWLLKWFHGLVGNWGVAIILLTIVVKLLTLYWTQKSMLSMRRMALVAPEIQKLREKYKDQKDRLNQEVMALYKRHGINPLGGCLPMLLQMPIWIALYTTISESVELYRSPFALWIRDLSQPDPYYITPVLLAGLTFLQTKMTPNPSQDAQAKMMMYMMPAMFLFFAMFVPSGLTVYWLVNTLLTMLHQLYMNRRYPR